MESSLAPQHGRRASGRGITGRLATDLRALDVAIALVLTIAAIAIMASRSNDDAAFRGDDILGAVLVLLQTLPLAARRSAPIVVLLVISVALVSHSAIGYEVVEAGTFGSLIAVYGAASLTDNRRSILAAGITAAAIAGFFLTNRADWSFANVAGTSGTWAIAWIAGTFVRLRGEQVEVAGARADRLERERDLRAREAVADERARMARELHDIVGHALNVIVIQSSGARHVLDTSPEAARAALASIETTGREALDDMERMLGVLRAVETDETSSSPQPGLAQLDALTRHVAAAGIAVQVIIEGAPAELPTSVDLSAYRIVQEALTNSLKHSRASRAIVSVRYGPDELAVEVTDNGHGSPERQGSNREGRGHLGMRERVALFGGDIMIGPLATGGGYRVHARLPYKSAGL